MATRLVLPKLPISAQVTLFGGDVVSGELFVAAASPVHRGPETLLELLNDNTRSFVPFQAEDCVMLLNRVTIRSVEFHSPELMEIFTRPDNESIYGLSIFLRTELKEVALDGFCFTGDLRPEARRPVDLLNGPEMFLLLYGNDRLHLVNTIAISHAQV